MTYRLVMTTKPLRPTLALLVLVLTISGCAAHKSVVKYPSEAVYGCGVEVVQKDGSTWVTPCYPESRWKKPYCVKVCK